MGNEKDEKQLERILKKLEDIKQFYSKIVSIYSISDDLVNIETNKDNALMEILTNHLNKNQGEINHLIETLNKEIKKIESIEKSISTIETFNNFMQSNTGDGTTTSRYKKLEAMLTNENITSLETKTKNIIQSYNQIYINNDPKQDLKVTELDELIDKLKEFHDEFFVRENKEPSRYEEIQDMFEDFVEKYNKAIVGFEKTEGGKTVKYKSYYNDIIDRRTALSTKLDELKAFHIEIFGDKEEDINGLKHELDERLIQLKAVEEEAKKVISLSSDAGLAGGFFQKGEQARKNKYISLGVFVGALLVMGFCNFFTIDFTKLKEIDIVSLAVRLVINAPFIWIATVANISLNKYARLEEEYAHKESLAKSFEKYKSEIGKIGDTDKAKSQELLAQLMSTNLKAFELNPAETMDKAKSDIPISLISNPKEKEGK